MIKYLPRRYINIVDSENDKDKMDAVRSALMKIESALPRKVFWDKGLYATRYTATKAIVSIYWDQVVQGVRERG